MRSDRPPAWLRRTGGRVQARHARGGPARLARRIARLDAESRALALRLLEQLEHPERAAKVRQLLRVALTQSEDA